MHFTHSDNQKYTDMKRFFVTLAAVALASSMVFAQDLSQATELYNAAAEALNNGDKEAALASFEQALTVAEALGEEGKDVLDNCKKYIPTIKLAIAKDLIKAKDFDAAYEKLNDAKAAAEKFEAADELDEINGYIPQVLLSKGNALLSAKDFAGASTIYKQILDGDATNGMAALRLGQALAGAGDTEGAIAAYEQAAANGQEANAKKQLSNIFLKNAAASLKEKKFADAVTAALKTCEYGENAQAYQIAAQASQLSGKNNDAIKYFEKYLQVAPDAKNAGQIAYTVGALYQQAKNNAKAKEFYTKALSDPKFGAEAKKILDTLN